MQKAKSPLEVLTKDDLIDWLMHPATKKVRFKVEQEIQRSKNIMGDGYTLDLDNVGRTAILTAREVGKIEGLDFIFNIEAD